jgi:hypothetical protein
MLVGFSLALWDSNQARSFDKFASFCPDQTAHKVMNTASVTLLWMAQRCCSPHLFQACWLLELCTYPTLAHSACRCFCLLFHSAGYWSPGGQTQPCKACGFGYTSPPGATSVEQCSVVNACPAGTVFRSEVSSGRDEASGLLDCVCKPGHGSSTGSGPCRLW